jgi:hypothetical protein
LASPLFAASLGRERDTRRSRASVRVGKAGFTHKWFWIRVFTTLISEASGPLKTKSL